jgi:hypothetical protein
MMAIPFNMPTFSENLQAIVTFSQAFLSLLTPLQITFSNYHKPKHEVVASLNFKLKDVTSNPTRFAPAIWCGSKCARILILDLSPVCRYHLYGSPVMPSTGM